MTVKPFSRVNYKPRNYNVVSAVMIPTYSVSGSPTSLNEGSAVTFTITTRYVTDGTILYWDTTGTTTAPDFTDGLNSGSVTITGNTATVVRTLYLDLLTEGSETVVFNLRSGSVTGTILASSSNITILDTSTSTITPSAASVNEGSSVSWTITTVGFGTGTLYWTNSGTCIGSRFTDGLNSGTITMTSDSGTLTRTLLNNLTTDGTTTIIISIRQTSISGPIACTSSAVTVNDTSTNFQVYSVLFNGTTQSYSVPSFTVPGDFTIECWGYITTAGVTIIEFGSETANRFALQVNSSGQLQGNFLTQGATAITGTPVAPINTWCHFAISRNGNTTTAWINGISTGTTTSWSNTYYTLGNSGNVQIGLWSGNYWAGYMSNLRVSNISLYPFVPSTTALTTTSQGATASQVSLLTAQLSTVVDSSLNGPGIPTYITGTTYGASFNGTNQYLTVPSNAAFIFNGDFTVEGWFYLTSVPGSSACLFQIGSETPNRYIAYTTSGVIYGNFYGGIQHTYGGSLSANTWYHIAFSRVGSTITCYVNGTSVGTRGQSGTLGNGPLSIGATTDGTQLLPAYITNVRAVNGTGVYTGAFTPSGPLTAITNTALLTLQSSTFIDNSNNALTITNNGSTAITNLTGIAITNNTNVFAVQSMPPGGYSYWFNGSNQYLTVTPPTFGTGDFTIEGWFYFTSIGSTVQLFDGSPNGGSSAPLSPIMNTNGGVFCLYANGAYRITGTTTIIASRWYHIALVRISGSTILYVNGVQEGSTFADTTSYASATNSLYIGRNASASNSFFPGYISNFRIVSGTGVYTTTFNPPITALTAVTNTKLLTAQSATIVDNSASPLTITNNGSVISAIPYPLGGYAQYFNGETLLTASNSNLAFGTSDFTMEFWMYCSSLSSQRPISQGTSTTGEHLFIIYSNGSSDFSPAGTPIIPTTAAGTFVTGIWQHVAICRIGTTVTCYVNGVSKSSGTSSYNFSATTGIYLGGNPSTTSQYFSGYLSNVRFINGTGLYTTAFNPPTTALTAITNTVLLMLQNATLIDNSSNNLSITNNQSTSTATTPTYFGTTPFANTYSYSFNGTSQYLTIPTSSFLPASNTYTIEFWMCPTAYPAGQAMLYQLTNATVGNFGDFDINLNSTGKIVFNVRPSTSASIVTITTTASVTLNVWSHIAVSVNSGSAILFINGLNSGTSTVVAMDGTQTFCSIGYLTNGYVTGQSYFAGFISNFRIVKNTALYSSNFTPATSGLQSTSNTLLLVKGATIADASSYSRSVTLSGTPTVSTFNPFNNYSRLFNGSSQYIDIPNNAAMSQVPPWTIEMWIYPTAVNVNCYLFGQVTTGWAYLNMNTNGYLIVDRSGVSSPITSTSPLTANTWYHIALVADGTNMKLYINGVQSGTTAAWTVSTASAAITRIGAYQNSGNAGSLFFPGYISNLRYIKGTALYPFVPPTSALTTTSQNAPSSQVVLLTAQSGIIVDNGNGGIGNPTYIATSTYVVGINATSQNLNTSSNNAFAFGTGDFTVEFWIYWISNPSVTGNLMHTNVSGTGFCMYWSSTQVQVARYLTAADLNITYSETAQNTWVHYAAVRRSGTMYVYRNGVLLGSGAVSTSYTQNGFYLFSDNTNTTFNGYITNVRVVKGLGVYTGTFTPSGPLTATQSSGTNIAAITGTSTSLLTLQNATFIDNSTNAFTITATGSPTLTNLFGLPITNNGTVTPMNSVIPFQNTYSYSFNGTNQYLYYPSTSLVLGSSNFTIEFWMYATAAPHTPYGDILIGNWGGGGGWQINRVTSNVMQWQLYNTNNTGVATISQNTWYHYAISRTGGNIYAFVNGALENVTANSYNATNTGFYIGCQNGTGQFFTGYISNMRVILGTGLYTANFAPPTAPLTPIANTSLLTNQYAELEDTSPNYFNLTNTGTTLPSPQNPFGNYSIFLNGTSQYLSIASNATLALGSGNFTVEMWVYINYANAAALPSTAAGIYDQRNGTNGAGVVQPCLELNSTGYVWYVTATSTIASGTTSIGYQRWQHIAVVRNSGTTNMYLDGVQVGSSYTDTNNYPAGSIFLGKINDGVTAGYLNGYISNVRTVIGTAVYTGAFTPPTATLATTQSTGTNIAAITGTATRLLTCYASVIFDGSYNANTITNNGTTPTVIANIFTGTSTNAMSNASISLNGTSQYLTAPQNTVFAFGTGNFTIETWVFPNGSNYNLGIFHLATASYLPSNATGLAVAFLGTNTFNVYSDTGGGTNVTATYSTNTWIHIALVKNNNVLTLYVNGIGYVVKASDTNNYTATYLAIGGYYGTSNLMTGYISNFRVVKGVAVYTGAFTPSVVPLTAITGTSLLTCQYNTLYDASANRFTITRTGNPDMAYVAPF